MKWARARGERDASETLWQLTHAGVIVGWHGAAEFDRPAAAGLRLVPIGLGMGSALGEPDQCSITYGFAGGTITVSRTAYTAWAASDGRQSLEEASRRAATALGMTVDDVWTAFHAALPELTAAGMALLDRT